MATNRGPDWNLWNLASIQSRVDGHERVFSEPSFKNTNKFECYIQMSD